MNSQTTLASKIHWFLVAIVLITCASFLTEKAAVATAPVRILIVDTELPGKANGDPSRIDRAVHSAGAYHTRTITWSILTEELLRSYKPSAIILSGQGTPWSRYNQRDLARLCGLLRKIQTPVLGICGGHQLLAIAFGGKVAPIKRLRPGPGYKGCLRERGWLPVKIVTHDSLFFGLATEKVWLNHCDEVKILPKGFIQEVTDMRASNQAIKCRNRPVYGVQFHPEISDTLHPYGEHFLRKFLVIFAK